MCNRISIVNNEIGWWAMINQESSQPAQNQNAKFGRGIKPKPSTLMGQTKQLANRTDDEGRCGRG
jgi:hypothetical protein